MRQRGVFIRPPRSGVTYAKRIHVHAMPLVVAMMAASTFSALLAGVMHENAFAASLLRPALGVGVVAFGDGRMQGVQASLHGLPVADEPAGVVDGLEDVYAVGNDNNPADESSVNVLLDANRAIALQIALQDAVRVKSRQ